MVVNTITYACRAKVKDGPYNGEGGISRHKKITPRFVRTVPPAIMKSTVLVSTSSAQRQDSEPDTCIETTTCHHLDRIESHYPLASINPLNNQPSCLRYEPRAIAKHHLQVSTTSKTRFSNSATR